MRRFAGVAGDVVNTLVLGAVEGGFRKHDHQNSNQAQQQQQQYQQNQYQQNQYQQQQQQQPVQSAGYSTYQATAPANDGHYTNDATNVYTAFPSEGEFTQGYAGGSISDTGQSDFMPPSGPPPQAQHQTVIQSPRSLMTASEQQPTSPVYYQQYSYTTAQPATTIHQPVPYSQVAAEAPLASLGYPVQPQEVEEYAPPPMPPPPHLLPQQPQQQQQQQPAYTGPIPTVAVAGNLVGGGSINNYNGQQYQGSIPPTQIDRSVDVASLSTQLGGLQVQSGVAAPVSPWSTPALTPQTVASQPVPVPSPFIVSQPASPLPSQQPVPLSQPAFYQSQPVPLPALNVQQAPTQPAAAFQQPIPSPSLAVSLPAPPPPPPPPPSQPVFTSPPHIQSPAIASPSPASASSPQTLAPAPEGPRPISEVRPSGPPNEIIPACPEDRHIRYDLDWYHHPSAPDFYICTRCHADTIQNTPLSAHFQRIHRPAGTVSACRFWFPRVQDTLWPEAIRTGDLSGLVDFFKANEDRPPCKGRTPSTGNNGDKWYTVTGNSAVGGEGRSSPSLDGFLACDTCYEYRVVGTGFESRLSLYGEFKETDNYTCDLCIPSIASDLRHLSKQNNWQGFVAATQHRLAMPECPTGEEQQATSGGGGSIVWYVPLRNRSCTRICEACYVDKAVVHGFGGEFERYQAKPGFRGFISDALSQSSACGLSRPSLSIALGCAAYQRDFGVFLAAAETVSRVPACTPSGRHGGHWWTVADEYNINKSRAEDGSESVNICEECYAGILNTTGVAQYFHSVQRDSGSLIGCTLCTGNPRFGQVFIRFVEMLDTGVFSHFADHACLWAGVQACPVKKARGDSRWWGYEEVLMCKECYLEFVADTPLAATLPVQNIYVKELRICQMWSPRMRRLWLETVAAGPPGSSESRDAEEKLRQFGTNRMAVYNQTVLQIEVMTQMRHMRHRQALSLGVSAAKLQGANSFAMAAGATDGYSYGSNSLGWHGTKYGAMGAQLSQQSQAGLGQLDATRGDETSQILLLQRIWDQVE